MAFTHKTLQFLFENKLTDSAAWFKENHKEYEEHVIAPLKELVIRLTPTMLHIDPNFVVEPKIGKTISRINRDIRFSKDKSLYRDVMWCVFVRPRQECEFAPGFVFEISPRGFRYGFGYYYLPTDKMNDIRELILEDSKEYKAAQKAYDSQNVFQMEGELFKRNRYPQESEKKQQWLNRKCIVFMHNEEDLSLTFSDDLADKIAEDFKLLVPIYKFLCKAAKLPL